MYFNKYNNRHREDDEEALRRQAYLENINRKKELIKMEFEKSQEEQKLDLLTIKNESFINFKNMLNELKTITIKKQENLKNIDKRIDMLKRQDSAQKLGILSQENQMSKMSIANNSFLKNSYKNRIFESGSFKSSSQADFLQKRLIDMKEEIETIKNNIENELINRTTRFSKLNELENSKKKMLNEINDLNFSKKMTFRRFDNLDTLNFNAQAKKKLSLFHLGQIKNELFELKSVENEFFKRKVSLVQQEKFDIDKEQVDLSKTLIHIDVYE